MCLFLDGPSLFILKEYPSTDLELRFFARLTDSADFHLTLERTIFPVIVMILRVPSHTHPHVCIHMHQLKNIATIERSTFWFTDTFYLPVIV